MSFDYDLNYEHGGAGGSSESVEDVRGEMLKILEQENGIGQEQVAKQVKETQAMSRETDAGFEQPEVDRSMTQGVVYRRPVTHTDTRTQTKRAATGKENDTCEIRSFPRSLVRMAKMSFPEASNTKAVAAYVYANRDMTADISYEDVPEDVVALAQTLDKYKAMIQMDQNIARIERTLKKLQTDNDDLLLAAAYLIYDRLGFRTESPGRPDEINFMSAGIREVGRRLASQGVQIRKEEAYQAGRPIS